MKRLHLLSLLLFIVVSFISNDLSAQSLYFCEDVDDDGFAVNESSVFNISDDGGYLYFLVRMGRGNEVDCDEVLFDIYKVDSNGEEKFDNTIYQEVEPDWNWFYKQITFYDRGTYKVYVYDEDWQFLTSNTVKIKYN